MCFLIFFIKNEARFFLAVDKELDVAYFFSSNRNVIFY